MSDDQSAAIYNYLRAKGASAFWADSALQFIRQGMNTNHYYTLRVLHHRATIKAGQVAAYKATLYVYYPDYTQMDCEGRNAEVLLSYTMDPTRRKAHRMTVKERKV